MQVDAAFRAAGIETTYDGDGGMQIMDGRVLGLRQLAADLASRPRFRWRRTVQQYVNAMINAETKAPPTTLEEIASLVYPRLAPTRNVDDDPIGNRAVPDYALPFADLHVLAALDYPSYVATLTTHGSLNGFGGWDAVLPLALRNLRRLPTPQRTVFGADRRRMDSDVHILASNDDHGASRALILDELVAAALHVERPTHGLLFAVPHGRSLATHVLEGSGVVAATRLLVRVARAEYAEAADRVSPHLYYRAANGVVERVSRTSEAGDVVIDATGSFGAALNALGVVEG